MRPQHDDHDGRPSPQPHPLAEPAPFPRDALTDTAAFRLGRTDVAFDRTGRVRLPRAEGKRGQHRLAKPGQAAKLTAAEVTSTGSIPRIPAQRPAPAAPPVLPRTEDLAAADAVRAIEADAVENARRFLRPAGPLTPGVGPVRALRGPVKTGRLVALGLVALIGVSALSTQSSGPQVDAASQSALDERAAAAAAADRSETRATTSPSASPKPSLQVTSTPKPKATTKPAVVKPVAGLTQAQMNNAQTVVQVGQKMGIPQRGLLVAIMTAMQESDLYNLASEAVPESFDYPHQGESVDHDSVGIFQQRASMGWGTVEQIMTPTYSARKFYEGLLEVSGWQNMELTLAAQAVQVSAYPYAYAKHETRARTILAALI